MDALGILADPKDRAAFLKSAAQSHMMLVIDGLNGPYVPGISSSARLFEAMVKVGLIAATEGISRFIVKTLKGATIEFLFSGSEGLDAVRRLPGSPGTGKSRALSTEQSDETALTTTSGPKRLVARKGRSQATKGRRRGHAGGSLETTGQ
jgi:hypothetical protein